MCVGRNCKCSKMGTEGRDTQLGVFLHAVTPAVTRHNAGVMVCARRHGDEGEKAVPFFSVRAMRARMQLSDDDIMMLIC